VGVEQLQLLLLLLTNSYFAYPYKYYYYCCHTTKMTQHTQQRPLKLEFVDSWDAIFHSHLIETEVREKISRVTFEQKLAHPIGTRLRKRVAEWVDAFLDQACIATLTYMA
jgi:hypothetical protein